MFEQLTDAVVCAHVGDTSDDEAAIRLDALLGDVNSVRNVLVPMTGKFDEYAHQNVSCVCARTAVYDGFMAAKYGNASRDSSEQTMTTTTTTTTMTTINIEQLARAVASALKQM
jgi:hypothetical protein